MTQKSFANIILVVVIVLLMSTVAVTHGAVAPVLPLVAVDTTMPTQTGATVTVSSSNCNDAKTGLQALLNAARYGDTIIIPAGLTCTGNYILPYKDSSFGIGWIVIKSSSASQLPENMRVTPARSSLMPKILTPNSSSVFATETSAHHYRFVGIEFGSSPSYTGIIWNLIYLGAENPSTINDLPSDIIFDRVYVHGTSTQNLRRGIAMNSRRTAVIDSYISDVHEFGADSQAIESWSGSGPFKIVNNYLEGAGENVMFGGSTAAINGLVPSDIEIRRNYFYKPLTWKVSSATSVPSGSCLFDPSYGSIGENFGLQDDSGTVIDWYKCVSGSWVKTGVRPDAVNPVDPGWIQS